MASDGTIEQLVVTAKHPPDGQAQREAWRCAVARPKLLHSRRAAPLPAAGATTMTAGMAATQDMSCVIIGEGTLPIICGEMLRERGHEVLAMISPDPLVSRWAGSNGIAHATGTSALTSLIDGRPFDCLFSIVNFQLLPDDIVAAARRYAVNYHDSPLPRYAGTHATSWALLNGETRYAVTWHLMTRRTDAGAILKQVPVEIDADDTALSLNAKCFEAAVAGFLALLDDMQAGAIDPQPQNRLERSFFQRNQRPPAGCTLPFDTPAEHLHALLRALDFGPYRNPLGLPKIALGESFVIVTELEVLDGRSGDVPGIILEITSEHLVVTTASDDVALAGFFTIDGAPLAMADVVARGGLRRGLHVPTVEKARATRLTAIYSEWSEHEPFWLEQLAGARPTTLSNALPPAGGLRRITSHGVAFGSGNESLAIPADGHAADHLLAAFMVYLAKLTGVGRIDTGFADSRLYGDIGDLHPFFSTCLPLRVMVDNEWDFAGFALALRIQRAQLVARGSYARDAPLRDPALRAQFDAVDPSAWPIFVEILDCVDSEPPQSPLPERVLTMRLQTDGKACTWLYDPAVLAPTLVDRMARQFSVLACALATHSEQPMRMLALLGEVASMV